jgi:hypothetical protein
MMIVTGRAKNLLLERKRTANINDPESGLRVSADQGGQWLLVADHPRDGDSVIQHEGVTVLLVSPDVQSALVGTKLDCLEASDGSVELALTRAGTDNDRA